MTIVVKKNASKKDIKALLQKAKKNTGRKSLRNVFGIFPFEGDAVAIQKTLRNEWN